MIGVEVPLSHLGHNLDHWAWGVPFIPLLTIIAIKFCCWEQRGSDPPAVRLLLKGEPAEGSMKSDPSVQIVALGA